VRMPTILSFTIANILPVFCKTKHHKSKQIKDAVGGGGAAIGSGVAVSGSITAVSAAGSVAGLSGAGVMSGLAAIGPAGVIGGIVTLTAIPAIVTNVAVSKTLSDDENLLDEERSLRRTGRIAAKSWYSSRSCRYSECYFSRWLQLLA